MADTIFRPQSNEEKKNFKDLMVSKKEEFEQQALSKIADIEQNTIYKKRTPYCSKCAINETKKTVKMVEESIKRGRRNNEKNFQIDMSVDFEKFGDIKNFELIGESEIIEDKLIDGIRTPIKTGIYKDFVCHVCGSKSSVQYSIKEVEAKAEKKDVQGSK